MAFEYVHVRDRETGHQYVVRAELFNPAAHEETGKPARDRHGDLAPIKFRTTVESAVARKSASQAAPSGQKAETEKE